MATYVVRRPFKTNGIMYEVGSVIPDPTLIRFFKTKLRDKKIVEVNGANFSKIAEYIKVRAGIDITERLSEADVNKNIKDEEAKRIADEEAKRIAADEEAKRIADEEAKRIADEEAKLTGTIKVAIVKIKV
jgi:membrane protein involved in colicin uptake